MDDNQKDGVAGSKDVVCDFLGAVARDALDRTGYVAFSLMDMAEGDTAVVVQFKRGEFGRNQAMSRTEIEMINYPKTIARKFVDDAIRELDEAQMKYAASLMKDQGAEK